MIEPSSQRPLPLDYERIQTRETVSFVEAVWLIFRRLTFCVGVGLIFGGLGNWAGGTSLGDIPLLWGIGGGLVALSIPLARMWRF